MSTLDMPVAEFVEARNAGRSFVLVDCREPWEYELAHLEGAVLIPLGQLQARAEEVPAGREVVVYCHHGVRSRQGALLLRRAGFSDARSLAGGIDEWSRTIDPDVPRY